MNPTVLTVIAEILGLLVLPAALLVQSFKRIRYILVGEIALNLAVAVSQLMLDGVAGAAQCVLAIVQTVLLFLVENKSRRLTVAVTVLCMGIYTVAGILTYAHPCDLLPLLSSLSYSVAVMQRRPGAYRALKNINCAANLAYDIYIVAYSLMLTHGVLLIGGILLSVKLDLLRRGAPEEPAAASEQETVDS